MAFLRTKTSRGREITLNLDSVLELEPVSKTDRRTRVTFNYENEAGRPRKVIVEDVYDSLDV